MGRELQKKKRRSGLPKAVRKPKSKKQVLNNPVIAANWNSKQTLSQNYARLGLTTRLNKETGGKENFQIDPTSSSHSLAVHPLSNSSSKGNAKSANGDASGGTIEEVRVERDPETGRIIRILDHGYQQKSSNGELGNKTAAEVTAAMAGRRPFSVHTNQELLDDSDSEEEFTGFDDTHAADGFIGAAALSADSTSVVQELTGAARAAQAQPKAKRRQSEREHQWCARMIDKHGHDYAAMFRDRSLNVLQLSEGQLKQKMHAFSAHG